MNLFLFYVALYVLNFISILGSYWQMWLYNLGTSSCQGVVYIGSTVQARTGLGTGKIRNREKSGTRKNPEPGNLRFRSTIFLAPFPSFGKFLETPNGVSNRLFLTILARS